MWCEHKISFANEGKNLMRYYITDKQLEGLKVGVTNSDRSCWSLKPTSESREAADNLTEHNCISGDKVSDNVN